MGPSGGNEAAIRVIGLGNDLLADDAFGLRVAGELRECLDATVDVVASAACGLHLLDEILGVRHLLVIDSVVTGDVRPGTLCIFHDQDVQTLAGSSPHASGLFDVLAGARRYGLPAPMDVTCITVEAQDCAAIGGAMHPAVAAAVGPAVERAVRIVREWQRCASEGRRA